MSIKKIISVLSLATMLLANSVSVCAGEVSVYRDTQILAGKERTSWATGTLHVVNSESTPYGYALTESDVGTVYKITAQVSLIDDDDYYQASEVTTAMDATYTESARIISRTKKAYFFGSHTVQKTSSSGTQTASTQLRVNY